MPDIDVKGLGVLSFPDEMSDTDIEKAIKEHPGYAKARDKSNFTPLIEPPSWVKNWLGDPRESPNPLTMTKEIGKGIPIAGHYIPQDEDMTAMEQNHPITTGIARGTGAIGSTAPLSAGMGMLTGAKLIPAMMGQASLGGGLAAGDVAAEKGGNVTADELKDKATTGAMWGAAGPLVSKMLSPGTIIASRPPPAPTKPPPFERPTVASIRARSRMETGVDQNVKMQLDSLLENRRRMQQAADSAQQQAAQNAARQATEARLHGALNPRTQAPSAHSDNARDILIRMAGAGVLPAMTHMHPAITATAAALGALAPHIPAAGAKYWHNVGMNQPGTKDIINALMISQGVGK